MSRSGRYSECCTLEDRRTAANATSAFAGIHLEIHELIAHEDKVIARFTNSGTNVGPSSTTCRPGLLLVEASVAVARQIKT